MYLNMALLREHLVPWDERTVRRKIKDHGFPASKDEGGQYLFKRTDVESWIKRREVRAG